MVEIISDDSVRRDRADKFDESQEHGVREYWPVDARAGREPEDFWVLDAQGRYQPGRRNDNGTYAAAVLPGFWLRPEWLRTDPLPSALAAFAEIAGPDAPARALRPRGADIGKQTLREDGTDAVAVAIGRPRTGQAPAQEPEHWPGRAGAGLGCRALGPEKVPLPAAQNGQTGVCPG